ncbi:MAG: GNAT family N-acetyltransferase [Acidobacteriota bacterium]
MGISIETVEHGDPGWSDCVAIRHEVFVVGQECPPDEEFDRQDAEAHHLLLRVDGRPAATARWRVTGVGNQAVAKLERFAVLEAFRGRGLGRQLVQSALDTARGAGHGRFLLHAQAHLRGFYAAFGFRAVGTPFVEAGIPHLRMLFDD